MRFTVALPLCHRSSLEARLGKELERSLEWCDHSPADVVIAMAGEGELATCNTWPGVEGALALLEAGLNRRKDRRDMERLQEVGRALASEQQLEKLLNLILIQARRLLKAEAGSIYLVVGEGENRELQFAHTQNAKVSLPYHRFCMPISTSSMAGFVAETGECLNIEDVYHIPEGAPYHFNDSFDRQAGYRTVSMLVVPLRDAEGEILGVLQLINRLEDSGEVCPFEPEHIRLAESLAGQAGISVKNAHLREEIEHLFDSFVNASVLAIEQRDPVTRGHSGRVANLTVALMEAVNDTSEGPFGPLRFSERQIREVRYASLLHDFGKVGVREDVLVKAKKLDAARLEMVLQRIRQRREERVLAQVLKDWASGLPFDEARWNGLQKEFDEEAARLAAIITHANEPSVLTKDVMADLDQFRALTFSHWKGTGETILTEADLAALKIPKGSLSESERHEIENHVTHTYHFLQQIPWTKDLAGIPEIAYTHHERVNGMGYPRKLTDSQIPVQSRAMAISDVFDALTAQDRPYKAAVSLEKSLSILESDARSGNLDPELLRIFLEAKVYRYSV